MRDSHAAYGVWMWARPEMRRRWAALLVLGLLAGITVRLAGASMAGARRADAAWGRLRQQTQASDAIVFASQAGMYDLDELHYDRLAELPYVEGAGAFGLWYGTSRFGQVGAFMTTYGHWLDGLDTPRIIDGRAPDPDHPDEVEDGRVETRHGRRRGVDASPRPHH